MMRTKTFQNLKVIMIAFAFLLSVAFPAQMAAAEDFTANSTPITMSDATKCAACADVAMKSKITVCAQTQCACLMFSTVGECRMLNLDTVTFWKTDSNKLFAHVSAPPTQPI